MRKAALRQQLDNYFRYNHSGSYSNMKHHSSVMRRVVRDLFQIGAVPTKWHALTHDHIQALVLHWKKEKLKTPTIMKYMTVIRGFLKNIEHPIIGIDNQSLGIINTKRRKKTIRPTEDRFDTLSTPLPKIMFELQAFFGLTLRESMRLHPELHVQNNSIWITRNIATNSLDRRIPIRNNKQKEILQTFIILCTQGDNLIGSYGYHQLRYSYNKELKTVGLAPSRSYRYLYARKLHAELSHVLTPYIVKQTIMREMGLQSRRMLWNYLNE